jgi:ribosomal protein S18 acetylase RimI-like enzyme
MNKPAANIGNTLRPLRPADLERVIGIDSAHVGEPRRRFFEKRLAHAQKHPEDFVQLGAAHNGLLVGFVFGRILRGEFGRELAIGTLDAVGVEHDSRDRGVGQALMDGLTKAMREKGVTSLQSQADWSNHGLLRFFDASGFGLAPRLVLERSVRAPLPEPVEDE